MPDFIARLDSVLDNRVRELSESFKGAANPSAKVPPMPKLLAAAMKNEWETTLLTSHWVVDEKDARLRVALARLAGDEAKHYQLIERRLQDLGGQIQAAELDQRTQLFHFLLKQTSTFARIVCGPYAREALAVRRNEVFLEHCRSVADDKTIALYAEIQKDEAHHHQLGRSLLLDLIQDETSFAEAQAKVMETLSVINDIQEMAVLKMGVCRLPGC